MAPTDIFAHVRRHARSSLKNQKYALALLVAVEETMGSTTKTPTTYFAHIMAVATSDRKTKVEEDRCADDINAISYLLAITMPHVPTLVLREAYEAVETMLIEWNQQFRQDGPILRHMCQIAAALIHAQDAGSWSSGSLNSLFQQLLLISSMDERPKVRKVAQAAVISILEQPPAPLTIHPAALNVLRFIAHILKECKESDQAVSNHALVFLKNVWIYAAMSKNAESIIYIVVSILSRWKDSKLRASCFEALEVMLGGWADLMRPVGSQSGLVQSVLDLQPNINDSNLMPLWIATVKNIALWLAKDNATCTLLNTVFDRIFNILQLSPHTKAHQKIIHTACAQTCSSIISRCLSKDFIDSQSIVALVSKCQTGLSLSFQPSWGFVLDILTSLSHRLENRSDPLLIPILQVLSNDEVYAKNEYFKNKREFQQFLGSLVEHLGPCRFLELFPLNLADSANESQNRAWLLPVLKNYIKNTELEFFINEIVPLSQSIASRGQQYIDQGMAIEAKMCAVIWRQLWDLLPSFCNFPTDLHTSFERLCQIIIPMLSHNDDRGPSICEALRLLVKSNCKLAKITSTHIKCDDDITDDEDYEAQRDQNEAVLRGAITAEQAQNNLSYLSSYAQHIYPPLFTKYVDLCAEAAVNAGCKSHGSVSPAQLKAQVYETIQAWVTIGELSVINQFFETTIRKFLESSEVLNPADRSRRHALLDLANAILSSFRLEQSNLEILYRIIIMGIQDTSDATIQKKCYKALCLLYTCSYNPKYDDEVVSERALSFRKATWESPSFLENLCRALLETTATASISAKRERLRIMSKIVRNLNADHPALSFIPSILSEAILATKEVNEKARNMAYELIVSMARQMQSIEVQSMGSAKIQVVDDDQESGQKIVAEYDASLSEYMKMVMAGLAGKTPHMISAAIHSLSRLIYEFKNPASKSKEGISDELLEAIIQTVMMYVLDSKNREIIKASIGFVKMIIALCPEFLDFENDDNIQSIIQSELPLNDSSGVNYFGIVVQALVKWTSEHKSHFKNTCRYSLERLIRRYGVDKVIKYVPKEHHKLIKNIRNRMAQKKKKDVSPSGKDGDQIRSFNDIVHDEASDDEDIESELPEQLQNLVMDSFKKNQVEDTSSLRIKEAVSDNDDDPIDFMDPRNMKNIVTLSDAKTKRKLRGKSQMKQSLDGRLIVNDSDSDVEGVNEEIFSADRAYMESIKSKEGYKFSADGKRIKFSNKRPRDEDDDTEESNRKFFSKNNKVKKSSHSDSSTAISRQTGGREYQSKKASGDVKKPGCPDPYAYIPFSKSLVTKTRSKNVRLNKKLLKI